MIKVKCAYCGCIFYAPTVRRVYCSDSCRRKAYRQKQRDNRTAYEDRTRQLSVPVYKGISETDPRSRLSKMKAHGILTPEYWKLYQEVDKQFYNGSGIVNGVSTQSPNFVEAVLFQIIEDGRVYAWINKDKEKL